MAGVGILTLGLLVSYYHVQGLLENVAKNKITTAAPYYNGWPDSNAVDGDHDVNGGTSTCYHATTGTYPAFWSVDLGQEYQLYTITVYLRSAFEYRTANSSIYLDNNPSRVCYIFPSTITNNPTILTCNETARHVTISNPGRGPDDRDTLNICEVEIYACSSGSYGSDCSETCNCPHCDRWSGICSGDCYPGWTGQKCDKQCTNTYGTNCAKMCVDRKCAGISSSCHHVTGSCDTGCLPGWNETDCTKDCDASRYAASCSRNCIDRHCIGSSSCDHVTGSCDQGCQPGWKTNDCTEACDSDHYGPDCTGVCATRHCEGTSSCNHTSGLCEGGCQAGWTGADCIGCDSFHYGDNCSKVCENRHCKGNSSCNSVTGSCDQGCEPGWSHGDCMTECDASNYGVNCSRNCNDRHCIASSSCHHVTGSCDQGCQSGWKNRDCTQDDQSAPVPLIAGIVAGAVFLLLLTLILVIVVIRNTKKAKRDHVYYNTATAGVEVSEPGSKVSQSLPDGSYDYIDVGLSDQTYTTIDPIGQGEEMGVSNPASDLAVHGENESVRTYEKFTSTSRDQDGDYTGLEKRNSYENVKRP